MPSKKNSIQESTGYLVSRLARSMERDFEQRLEALRLTRGAFAVLSAIHHDKKTKPAELAAFIGVDGAAITRHLDRLEKTGLIERKPSATDRRSTDIHLTSVGAQAICDGVVCSKATNSLFTTGLSKVEVNQLQSVIRKMLANADSPVSDI